MRLRLLLLLLICAAGLYGCPSCPYDATCDGNTLLTCSLGVDQLVGSPEERAIPCESPNPVCLEEDDRNATCGIDPARTCQSPMPTRCEGDLVISCQRGFEVAEDCTVGGNVCGEVEGEARCYLEPLTPCGDAGFMESCSGDRHIDCRGGYVLRRDCTVEVPDGTCKVIERDGGTSSVFCGVRDPS